MIKLKKGITKKEKVEIRALMYEIQDIYGDFYITRNNLRLFIKENIDLLYDCLKKGDQIAFGEEEGIVFITGWSDNAKRKYIKILSRTESGASKLLKVLSWDIKCDLYIKIKKNNPIKKVLEQNRFRFCGDRGREILLVKKVFNPKQSKENNHVNRHKN